MTSNGNNHHPKNNSGSRNDSTTLPSFTNKDDNNNNDGSSSSSSRSVEYILLDGGGGGGDATNTTPSNHRHNNEILVSPLLQDEEILSPIAPYRSKEEEEGASNNDSESIYYFAAAADPLSSSPTTMEDAADQDNTTERMGDVEGGGGDESYSSTLRTSLLSNQQRQSGRFFRSWRRRTHRRELSGLNYLNAVTYVVHVMVWWGIAVWGLDGLVKTHWQQTENYETLLTPTTWAANYLWIPIVFFEALFAVAQLVPHYRSRPIVTSGTSFWFFYTVLLQIAHTILYSLGLFVFSFVTAALALFTLLMLLVSQHRHAGPPRRSVTEYVLFRFPFYLHAGYMMVLTMLHFGLLFRRYCQDDWSLQIAIDVASLASFLPVATYALTSQNSAGPDFVIPSVILWAYIGIACRLQHPSTTVLELYGADIVRALLIAVYFFMGMVGCCFLPVLVVCLARTFCIISVVELD